MKVPEEFNNITEDMLQPFGYMPEGLPRILPPFGRFEKFKIADQFTYISRDGVVVQVPENTLTDLASVPRPFRGLLKIPGRESAGAVVHDSGYGSPLRPRWNLLKQSYELLSKKDWDNLFNEINIWAEVGIFKRKCMNLGLKIGGWTGWSRGKTYNPTTLPYRLMPLKENNNENSWTDNR